MIMRDVLDEIAGRVDTIDGLRVSNFGAKTISPPAAIITLPKMIEYDQTYDTGSASAEGVAVWVLVGHADARSSHDRLCAYLDGKGPKSIRQAVTEHQYLSCAAAVVTKAEPDIADIGGVQYLAAVFTVDVFGNG